MNSGSCSQISLSCSCPIANGNSPDVYETQIFLNLRVHYTNVLDLEEVHPCYGYSSTNLDRIRLQNSRFFSQNRFRVA